MNNSVMFVLGHSGARAEFRTVFDEELAGGRVLVFEVTCVALCVMSGMKLDVAGGLTTLANSQ
jgi:hypothetical protein